MALNFYKLKAQLHGKLKKMGKDKCVECGTELKPSDNIASTAKHKRFYCEKCAKRFNMVVS